MARMRSANEVLREGADSPFRTAKMMYVLQPMFLIAGGVMYTIRKLQIQLEAVEIDEPR